MATESVSIATENKHVLWITGEEVLEIRLDRPGSNGCPPRAEHVAMLNSMVQDLARAAKAVIYQAENDGSMDMAFSMQPIAAIADSIILLTQLSGAVSDELTGAKA